MPSNERSFTSDERAIEGLPIRLVIALVVGVASLALMLQVLDGFGGVGQTEVKVNLDNQTFDVGGDGNLTVTVVDENGKEIEGATVVFEPDTAQGDLYEINMGEDEATREIDDFPDKVNADLRADQNRGEYSIIIHPPTDSDLEDDQENTKIAFHDN